MQTKTTFKFLGATLFSLLLASCGGGDGSALDNTINNGGTSSSVSINTNWKLGSGSGSSFTSGAIGVVITDTSGMLYIGDKANLNISVVTEADSLITGAIPVEFSSPCISSGKAQIVGGNKVNITTGNLSIQYQSDSCIGTDIITATVSHNNKTLTATGSVKTSNLRLGLGVGVNFIPSKLDLGANYDALFDGQTTTLTVNLVNDAGSAVQTSIPVTFLSACISAGSSTITGGNTVNSIAGTAKAEYKAGTCFGDSSGDETVRASTTYAGNIISASATIPKINNKRMGSGTGANFTPGLLTASSSATLFEGDTVQLTANIVDNQNTLISQPIKVLFDSPCITAGTSTVIGGNIVDSLNGVAKIQYKVGKCNIDDVVTATTDNGTSNIKATIALPINTRRIGSGFGQEFNNGALEVGIGVSNLSPGGNTSVTAYIVNTEGELVTDSMNVTFSSPCLSSGSSIITGGNVVASVNGKATANYISNGCKGMGGADAIQASTTFRSTVLTATNYIFVKADSAQTISFVDATPPLVSLKGTGGVETSTLRFRVSGQTGNPLKGECVTFALSTTVGDLALVPSNCNPAGPEVYGATTDANGYVSTIIQAGTVATVVRVTATTANGISTQSSALAVTTGIPDQNSASLSLNLNPVSWLHDGVTSSVVIRLADAFNNPVPNGTAVTFTTSGGAIDGSCTTLDGACTAIWRSQSPRPNPAGTVSFSNITEDGDYSMSCSDGSIECRKGRVQIIATAIGNESFVDGNGNGLYDDINKDTFTNSNGVYNSTTKGLPLSNTNLCRPNSPQSSGAYGATNSCDDLREAYVDKNFNFERDNIEEFVDFNKNGQFDPLPNGKYDGALCSGQAKANGDCTTNKVTVRDQGTLVMSCENPYPLVEFNDFSISAGESKRIPIFLADCNGNALPTGTTVTAVTDNLVNATASINISGGLPTSTEPMVAILTVKADDAKAPKGFVGVKITSAGVGKTVEVAVNKQP